MLRSSNFLSIGSNKIWQLLSKNGGHWTHYSVMETTDLKKKKLYSGC